MRRILGLGCLFVGGLGCTSETPPLILPAPAACEAPAGGRAIHDHFDCGPGWLAVDDARVYWAEMSLADGTESIVAGGKCGGDSLRLGTPRLGALAPADGMLYGFDPSSFFAVPVDGRARVAIATGFTFLSAMALDPSDDTAVLVARFVCSAANGCVHPGSMWRVHRRGGAAETILPESANAMLDAVAVAPDGYYVLGSIDDGARGVYHLGRDGTILEKLLPPSGTDLLVVDPANGDLFVRTDNGMQVREDDSFRNVWPTAPADVQSFALDEPFMYAAFADGHLARRPRGGGAETTLLQGGRVVAVGLDAGAIYAFDCSLSAGRILQLPRLAPLARARTDATIDP